MSIATMMPTGQTCLRDVQKSTKYRYVLVSLLELLKEMLNLNGLSDADGTWKILVLDSVGQNILSPVLKVNELRESGVTLYL